MYNHHKIIHADYISSGLKLITERYNIISSISKLFFPVYDKRNIISSCTKYVSFPLPLQIRKRG